MRAVMSTHIEERRFIIGAGVAIAAPMIDREAAGGCLVLDRRLAKSKITLAAIGSQLDQNPRLQLRDQVISEIDVLGPRSESVAQRFEIPRRQSKQWSRHSHSCRIP